MGDFIKKEVTLGQLLAVATTLLTMILISWVNMTNRVQALEIKTNYRESDYAEFVRKLDKIQEDVSCIKVDLKGKRDK